jgi:hypothetical protein
VRFAAKWIRKFADARCAALDWARAPFPCAPSGCSGRPRARQCSGAPARSQVCSLVAVAIRPAAPRPAGHLVGWPAAPFLFLPQKRRIV